MTWQLTQLAVTSPDRFYCNRTQYPGYSERERSVAIREKENIGVFDEGEQLVLVEDVPPRSSNSPNSQDSFRIISKKETDVRLNLSLVDIISVYPNTKAEHLLDYSSSYWSVQWGSLLCPKHVQEEAVDVLKKGLNVTTWQLNRDGVQKIINLEEQAIFRESFGELVELGSQTTHRYILEDINEKFDAFHNKFLKSTPLNASQLGKVFVILKERALVNTYYRIPTTGKKQTLPNGEKVFYFSTGNMAVGTKGDLEHMQELAREIGFEPDHLVLYTLALPFLSSAEYEEMGKEQMKRSFNAWLSRAR